MTAPSVQSSVSRTEFVGDGETSQFDIPFALYDDEDLSVYLNDNLLSSGYQLTGQRIAFVSAPKVDVRIRVVRFTRQVRKTRFRAHHEFRAKAINLELDRLLAMIQDLQRQLTDKGPSDSSAPTEPPQVLDPSVVSLPKPEAGKVIGWTDTGKLGNFERGQTASPGVSAPSRQFEYMEVTTDGLSPSYELSPESGGSILADGVQVFLDGVHQSKTSYQLVANAIKFKSNAAPPKDVQLAVHYGVASLNSETEQPSTQTGEE